MELLERQENPLLYTIRAKGTGALNSTCIEVYYASDHTENYTYTSANHQYGEVRYTLTNTDEECRLCFKLWFSEETDKNSQISLITHVFAVITNLEEAPEKVIEFYCQRGNSENFTKELKNDFGANTLSHEQFVKNAFEFFAKSLAYNLFQIFRNLVLEGEDRKMQAVSFRKKYQKVASRLSRHARQLYLRMASSFRYQERFKRYFQKCCMKLPCFSCPASAT